MSEESIYELVQSTLFGELEAQRRFKASKYVKPKPLVKPKEKKYRETSLEKFGVLVKEKEKPKIEEFVNVCFEVKRAGLDRKFEDVMYSRPYWLKKAMSLYVDDTIHAGDVVIGRRWEVDIPKGDGVFILQTDGGLTPDEKLRIFANEMQFFCVGKREPDITVCIQLPTYDPDYKRISKEAKDIVEFFDMYEKLPESMKYAYKNDYENYMIKKMKVVREIDKFIEEEGKRCAI